MPDWLCSPLQHQVCNNSSGKNQSTWSYLPPWVAHHLQRRDKSWYYHQSFMTVPLSYWHWFLCRISDKHARPLSVLLLTLDVASPNQSHIGSQALILLALSTPVETSDGSVVSFQKTAVAVLPVKRSHQRIAPHGLMRLKARTNNMRLSTYFQLFEIK